jgi:SAM-dependent methyltransferase
MLPSWTASRSARSRTASTRWPHQVDDQNARRLLSRLTLPQGSSVVDLGCGQGAWLLLLAAHRPDLRLLGVDTSGAAIAEARAAAGRLGYSRMEWVQGDAATVAVGTHDAVLCIGASHAFGGLSGTLAAVRERMKPGGYAVVGDMIWEQEPTPAAQQAVEAGPDDLPDLADLVSTALRHGYEVVDGHASTLQEWDAYEWAWTGAVVRWAMQQPEGSDHAVALAAAREHREAWLSGYRRNLGFATVVLVDLPDL